MRTRTSGIQFLASGERSVDKQYRGQRIFERLGKVSQAEPKNGSSNGKPPSMPSTQTNFERAMSSCSQLQQRST